MPTLSPCPDAAVLQNLVDGQLPSDILEALVKHLDQCHHCAELIRALAAQSTQNVRLENTEELSVPPELVALIAELRQLPNQQSTTSGADPLQESQPVVLDNGTKQYQLPDKLERIAHYHIRTILGRGGMGYVFLAHDTHLDRQVALKVLRPDLAARRQAKERFLREARLAARLKSEHIITIYQVGEENGIPFLAMELLQGCTLYSLLEQEGRIGLERAVRIARQIAQGLAVAHEHGLVHRDVKPGNIWIEPHNGERVKLLDFGLARLHEEGESLTETGAILGTPAYMAPEQACGEKVDARADLWSLGVILYELTTGRKPFTGSNTLAVLSRIALEQPVPPQALNPDLPSELSTLILRLLEKEPAKRPASAREVIAVLTAIESYGSIETLPNIKSPPLIQTPTFPSPDQNERTPLAQPTRRQPRWWATAAIGLVFAPLAYFLGGALIRIATNQGELLVEVDDPTIELRIVQNGVIVQDRTSQREFTLTAGKGEIEVYEKNGVGPLTTRQFVLNRGGKTTVRVSWQELADARKSVPAPPPSDKKTAEDDQSPDRRAALYVISVGGVVHVEGIPQTITDAKQLPTGNFRLTQVGLRNCYRMSSDGLAVFSECQHLTHLYMFETGATDAGLAHFKKCKNLIMLEVSVNAGVTDAGLAHFKGCPLKHLGVASTQVTDAGLAHFQNCKELEYIDFSNTSVTDVGLAYFKNCQHLGHLSLQSTKISDAGLVHFAQCRKLYLLELSQTAVTDAGLAHFKECNNLRRLALFGTRISDAGLAYFKGCRELEHLDVSRNQITDAGLVHFKECRKLAWLDVSKTQITDAGLAHFKDCQGLTGLDVSSTAVTDLSLPWICSLGGLHYLGLDNTRISREGYERVKSQYPHLNIKWSERNHTAALQVLKAGGEGWIVIPELGHTQAVTKEEHLIWPRFQLRRVKLQGMQDATELLGLLGQLNDQRFDRCEKLQMAGVKVFDLALLNGIQGLKELEIHGCWLDDVKLGRLPALPTLQRLVLDANEIRAPGVFFLTRTQPQLEELSLGCSSIDITALIHLPAFKKLKHLSVATANIDDSAVPHLAKLTTLQTLNLRGTKITADGVAALQKALPRCQIVWDGSKERKE